MSARRPRREGDVLARCRSGRQSQMDGPSGAAHTDIRVIRWLFTWHLLRRSVVIGNGNESAGVLLGAPRRNSAWCVGHAALPRRWTLPARQEHNSASTLASQAVIPRFCARWPVSLAQALGCVRRVSVAFTSCPGRGRAPWSGPSGRVTETNAFCSWSQHGRFDGRRPDPDSSPEVHGQSVGRNHNVRPGRGDAGTMVAAHVTREVGLNRPIWSRSCGPIRAADRRSVPFVSDVDRVRP